MWTLSLHLLRKTKTFNTRGQHFTTDCVEINDCRWLRCFDIPLSPSPAQFLIDLAGYIKCYSDSLHHLVVQNGITTLDYISLAHFMDVNIKLLFLHILVIVLVNLLKFYTKKKRIDENHI